MADVSKKRFKAQPKGMIFALDIGTRSIIGIVGTVEGEKLHVIAMEKVEHTQRSMIDGQIEDIEQVAKVAQIVKSRLEERVTFKLKRVCVAAAGRALRTQRASYEMTFPKPQRIDAEIVSQLEASAIGEAEDTFVSSSDSDNRRQFYLVGHTAIQFYMDNYPISSLLDHQAQQIKVDVIATFLPREVVDSLYAAMHRIDLEVASLTLEPIAAINAVIPKNLRLLNLALVDIGAGTSDIAVSRDGGVVGYTMVTVAGDEITEALMKKYLLDFNTAELVKTQLGNQSAVSVTDILGFEQTITQDDMMTCIEESATNLCREIAEHICVVNGGPTSAVFLAGGGSKLASMRDGIAKYMNIDVTRVAIAGNNFQTYAFSDTYDLNDPEFATPLGIAISSGLNMITESFHVTLNGSRAKLFRSSTVTVLDILMMNGYSSQDLLPRTGHKLVISLNGKKTVFYGTPGEPAVLRINGNEAKISDIVHTGDIIEFIPAQQGQPARRRLKDLLTDTSQSATVNGKTVSSDTLLKTGDIVIAEPGTLILFEDVLSSLSESAPEATENATAAANLFDLVSVEETSSAITILPIESSRNDQMSLTLDTSVAGFQDDMDCIELMLNNEPIAMPMKLDGSPYYLMDMVEVSGIDLDHPEGPIMLRVNGAESSLLQDLKSGDHIEIFFGN